MIRALGLILILTAGVAGAEGLTTSTRPVARPVVEGVATLRPIARPVLTADTNAAETSIAGSAPALAMPEAAIMAAAAVPDVQTLTSTRTAPQMAAPMGFVDPTSLAVVVSARPAPRGGNAAGPVETITGLIASGAIADAPMLSFVSGPTGVVAAVAPARQAEAAAPMGLILASAQAVPVSSRPQARVREDRSYRTRAQYRADQNVTAFSPLAVPMSLRPMLRPAALTRQVEEARAAVVRGSVCGDPAIQGTAIGDVPGPGACGIDNAVRLRSISGIGFTGEDPRVNCDTARALKRWIDRGALPAIGTRGGGLAQISVMGTYSCRNQIGSGNRRLSEHSFGKAFDIGGFKLRDGTTFTVLRDWGTAAWGDTLRAMHRAACGPFGTVLGPNANAAHRNHFHFDTAGYRGGSYCR